MQFLNPTGAWALLALPVILALYMLRRRHEQLEVPSSYLWRQAVRAQQVERPLERLRRNLLMILQLLLALLLALGLMQPALWGGGGAQEQMLVFDTSASMGALSGGETRLDLAKREAARMLDALPEGSRLSILCAGSEVRQVAARVTGKQQMLRALDQVQGEQGAASLTEALSLASAIQRELPEMQISVFSDAVQAEPQPGVRLIPVGQPAQNRAIASLTAGAGRALARVANYGGAARVTLECYADGSLCDVRSVDIEAGGSASVRFDLPEGAAIIRAILTTPDALPADDERFCAIQDVGRAKVVLAGASNIFLEKALLLSGAQLIKTTAAEAASIEDAELYVFDGALPDPLPERGALLLVNPDRDALGFTFAEPQDGGAIQAAQGELAQSLAEGLTLTGAQLRSFRPVDGGSAVLLCQGQPIAAFDEENGRPLCAIGFDLHESNLPMKYDFPVLMHNLLGRLLPDALSEVPDAVCGQRLMLPLSARCAKAEVVLPSGESVAIAPPFPALPLAQTGEAGQYLLRQTLDGGGTKTLRFSVSIPPEESDLRRVAEPVDAEARSAAARYGRELTTPLLMALLGILLIEWWVSRRED